MKPGVISASRPRSTTVPPAGCCSHGPTPTMRPRSMARKPSSWATYDCDASRRNGSATGVKIRARNSFTRSDPARDFFFRLFGLDQFLEHERLSGRRDLRRLLGQVERSAERQGGLRDRGDKRRLARRQHRRLFFAPASLALFGFAKFFV